MAWLIVPSITSSPSAPAWADSNSASCSPSLIAERLAGASCTSRGKLLPSQAWQRRWTRGGFIRRLSGLTLPPSTAAHGVDLFISSLRETLASQTPWPASVQEVTTSASSPPKSSASPLSAGLIVSSARTCRGTRTDSSRPSPAHWKGWATALRSEFSARKKPATRCGGNGCSSWPSAKTSTGGWERDRNGNVYPTLEGAAENWRGPNASMALHGPMDPEFRKAAGQTVSLDDQASQWMAPNVPNGGRTAHHAEVTGRTAMHNGKKVQIGLEHQAQNWAGPKATDGEKGGPNQRGSKGDIPLPAQTAQWAAPCAMNHKGSSEGSITRQDGKSRADLLHYQAEQFFLPPSSPDQPTLAGGSMSSTAGPNSNQPSAKRKLNPIFVEALMRWPTGLSGFERPETALIRSPLPGPISASTNAFERWFAIQSQFLNALVHGQRRAGADQMDLFA